MLLSRTGNRNFIEFVLWLVLIATIIIVLRPILLRRDEGGRVHPNITMALWPVAIAGIFLVALYGGYFGAGIGILMIGALSIFPGRYPACGRPQKLFDPLHARNGGPRARNAG